MTYSNERLDRIEAQQEANTQAIAALAEQLTVTTQAHDRRMTDHDRRMADHDRRMADHDRRMADHDRRMADHDRRLAQIEQQLARLAQLTERFVDQTLSHEQRLAALERSQ